MDFRVLGTLEVIREGRPLDLSGQKRRALLVALLLESNRVVSTSRLIDALWEEEPPATAHKALQLYVSQLRKLLGRERLQTKAPGYLLRVEPDELDLTRFERMQSEGRLREALSLWRGPPLADFADQRFAQAEIARLEELRLVCLEELTELDLATGRHAELVGELEARVQEYPMREGQWYNAQQIEDTVTRLNELAGLFGYAFADVRPNFNRDREHLTMGVTFRVSEAPRVYVERIDISGNTTTHDKVVRREFRLAEGDPFNNVRVRRSRDRIQSLGFFQENLEIQQNQGSWGAVTS